MIKLLFQIFIFDFNHKKLSTKLVLTDEIRVKELALVANMTELTQLVAQEMAGPLEAYEIAMEEFMKKNPGYDEEAAAAAASTVKTEGGGGGDGAEGGKDQSGRKVSCWFAISY